MIAAGAPRKYPRTPHLAGSRVQPGDDEVDELPFAAIAGRHLVVAEKLDGANAAISFAPDGTLRLQSRGHYLTGGPREAQFALFKRWAHAVAHHLRPALGDRYVLYGEWLYAKHTIFYDRLPHYFLAFDLLDVATGAFLDTPRRNDRLAGLPIHAVPVLSAGAVTRPAALARLLGRSPYISDDHLARLRDHCLERGLDPERIARETDPAAMMEGLYVKVEEGGVVRARCKFVRQGFLTSVVDSGSHWLDRPLLPNLLRPGADLFAARVDR